MLLGIVLAGTGLLVLLLTWWLRRDAGRPAPALVVVGRPTVGGT